MKTCLKVLQKSNLVQFYSSRILCSGGGSKSGSVGGSESGSGGGSNSGGSGSGAVAVTAATTS